MTERRANDLSYGHLGEATYDIETGEWSFLQDPFSQNIQELLPLNSVTQASTENPLSKAVPSKQTNSVIRSIPETFPAGSILTTFARTEDAPFTGAHTGNLLAIGSAIDTEQTSGSRKATIIATSTGESGHVLQLIKPRIQKHEWGSKSSVRLSLLDTESKDRGYWVGVGGRILQIAVAEDINVPAAFLAVRQAHSTTIFRPVYAATRTPAIVPNGYSNPFPSSRLSADPVGVLNGQQAGMGSHVDVTFNPWYSRQCAVVDEFGAWMIWDIEGRRKVRLVPGKRASIFEGYIPDPVRKAPSYADGWHKILWAGSVSTVFVCNRRHVAIFDTKAGPVRIPEQEFFSASNTDWILDVKRSPSNLSHIILLTSSRIYLLKIMRVGEEKDGAAYKLLLSYRHYRDANDTTMRVTVMNPIGDAGKNPWVSAVISSSTSSVINTYTFSFSSTGLEPTSSQSSLILSNEQRSLSLTAPIQQCLQTLHIFEVPLEKFPDRPTGPETQYLENDIKFFQVLSVSTDFRHSSGLWSIQGGVSQTLQVQVPSTSYIDTSHYMTTKRVKDPWIIPDGEMEDEEVHLIHRTTTNQSKDDSRLTINFNPIFQRAFSVPETASLNLDELLQTIMDRIRHVEDVDQLSMSTLLDLSQIPEFTEDLEHAAPLLRAFLGSLETEDDSDRPSTLVVTNLALCPGMDLQAPEDSSLPDLLKIYDQVAQSWIATLPRQVPSLTRLAKFKIARKVAVELYLSSIALSMRNKSVEVPSLPSLLEPEGSVYSKSATTSRAGSPALFSSQLPSNSWNDPAFSLPTPSLTPSLYSQSHASSAERAEDPAILRLRQYAPSIKAKPDLGSSKILSYWPVAPGVDPATYSWEDIQRRVAADESGEEADPRKKREMARRRRRTERFLSRESTAATEAYSQPSHAQYGSQPDAVQYAASSQTIADVPMTQPDRGTVGSRAIQSKKSPRKKKRAAGFR